MVVTLLPVVCNLCACWKACLKEMLECWYGYKYRVCMRLKTQQEDVNGDETRMNECNAVAEVVRK